jgi:C4-dicarboxylate-specific signal transduction histidine kinase
VQLQQAILNLIINAVEAMSGMREEPRIRRRSSRHTARPACRGGIPDNPAMNRLEMPFGDGALAVAY